MNHQHFANDNIYIERVQRIYGDLNGDLHLVDLQRNGATTRLGLSLAGNRDIATMSVFVIGVDPSSVAGLDGRIRVGDELLEVNGRVLHGRSHLNASAIIKGILSAKLKILLLRSADCLEKMAVDPILPNVIEYKDSLSTLIPRKKLESISLDGSHPEDESGNDGEPGSDAGDPFASAPSVHCDPCNSDSASDINDTHQSASCDILSKQNEIIPSGDICFPTNNRTQEPPTKPKLHLKINGAIDNQNLEFSKTVDGEEILPSPNRRRVSCKGDITSPETASDIDAFQNEIVEDPLTCAITSGRPTVISIQKGKQPLGIQVIGGSDTVLKSVYISEIYRDGAASKDGRLMIGDQILEVNDKDLSAVSQIQAIQMLRRPSSILRLVVLRENPAFHDDELCQTLSVELFKKPGKGLGLSIVSKRHNTGVVIADIIKGGAAEFDGRLMVGDEITLVNGEDVCEAVQDYAAELLKTLSGKVSLFVRRPKLGLKPINLLESAYICDSKEGSLKKSESQTADCKNIGKSVAKRRPILHSTVASCLQPPDE